MSLAAERWSPASASPRGARAATLARGALALAFAAAAFAGFDPAPGPLVLPFGVFAILLGGATVWAALTTPSRALLFAGVIDAIAGILLVSGRWVGPHAVPHVVGAWAVLTGVLETIGSPAPERPRSARFAFAAAGAVVIVLGVLFGVFPEGSYPRMAQLLPAAIGLAGAFWFLAALALPTKTAPR